MKRFIPLTIRFFILVLLLFSVFLNQTLPFLSSNALAASFTGLGPHCNSPNSTELAVDNSQENLVLFNIATTSCLYSKTQNFSVINQSLVPANLKDTTYDKVNLQGTVYYPITPGQTVANVALVAGSGTPAQKGVYAVYWTTNTSVNYPQVNLSSVRVTKVITNADNLAMLELDNLNKGAPSALWFTNAILGTFYKVPWANISALVDPWIRSIQNNTYTPIPTASEIDPTSTTCNGTSSCQFYNGTLSTTLKFVNDGGSGLIYAGDVEKLNSPAGCAPNNHAIVLQFNATTGTLNKCFDTGLDTTIGYTLPGFSYAGNPESQLFSNVNLTLPQRRCSPSCKWDIDGIGDYTNGTTKYLVFGLHNTNAMLVMSNVDKQATASIVGDAVLGKNDAKVNGCINGYPSSNSCGIDGVESDATGQFYLAGEDEGIYSAAGSDIIASALANGQFKTFGPFIFSPNISFVNTYRNYDNLGTLNGVKYVGSWDHIAPLEGVGSAPSISAASGTPYYQTSFGPVYSQGGFSITNLNNKSYGDGLVLGGVLTNGTTAPLNFTNGTGSAYKWNFSAYNSNLNHLAGQSALSLTNGYASLLNTVCVSTTTCKTIQSFATPDTITSTDTSLTNYNSYKYTPTGGSSGTLTINEDTGSGGLNQIENGMLFVNGNVVIDADHQCNATIGKLLIIASGSIVVQPSPNALVGASTPQCINNFLISDKAITFANYSSPPNAYQQLIVNGSAVSMQGITQNLDIGPLNATTNAIGIKYDNFYLKNFAKSFISNATYQEVGR